MLIYLYETNKHSKYHLPTFEKKSFENQNYNNLACCINSVQKQMSPEA